jgi:mannosyltransferase OCH1-like enzyme
MTDCSLLPAALQDLKTAKAMIADARFAEGRALLDRIAADVRLTGMAGLGSRTALGLPRKLHSAYLKLAKAEGRSAERIALQYSLVPPPELLMPLAAVDEMARRQMNSVNRQSVPRILHQIWIGPLAVPAGVAAWRHHAEKNGLVYRLWREDDLARIGVYDHPSFAAMIATGDFPGAVDVARYAVLLAEGGIYLDCDWYPAREDVSFADLLPLTGLTALAEDTPRNTGMGSLLLTNSLLAAPAGHPAFARLLDILPEAVRLLPEGPAWWSTGPLILTLVFRGTSFSIPDVDFVAANLPRQAPVAAVEQACRNALAENRGLLINWKSW